MQRTYYYLLTSGLLSDSDLLRARPRGRRSRPVALPDPGITVDLGDPADAVDAGWRHWKAGVSRAA